MNTVNFHLNLKNCGIKDYSNEHGGYVYNNGNTQSTERKSPLYLRVL